MKNLSQTIKSLIIALILVGGISYVFAWTGPTQAPTGGNVPAPINVGSGSQTKTGDFTAKNITATGQQLFLGGYGLYYYGDSTNMAVRVANNGAFYIQDTNSNMKPLIANDVAFIGGDGQWHWLSSMLNSVNSGGTPSGAVMAFNLSSCPSGWSAFTQGNGRVILGTGDSATTGSASHTLLQQGGEEKHLQAANELAVHSHASYYQVSSAVNTSGASGGGSWAFTKQFSEAGAWTNTGNTPASGTQVPMSIMDPYVTLLYCQKN